MGNRRWFWKGFLGLALLPLIPGSCQRRSQVPVAPVAPPPPNYVEQADRSFDSGDYPGAISAYSVYLRENPSGAQLDRVLFQLGLAYALPGNPEQDSTRSIAYLNELVSRFPASLLRPQAEMVARLQEQIQQLRSEVDLREQQLRSEMGQRERQMIELSQQMEKLKLQSGDIQRLQTDLNSREERIRQLSDELEKLKAIDMQRRSPNPPR